MRLYFGVLNILLMVSVLYYIILKPSTMTNYYYYSYYGMYILDLA